MKKTGNLWAIAPDYLGLIQKLALEESEPAPNATAPDPLEIAARITASHGPVAVISISGPINRQSELGFFSGDIWEIGQDAIAGAIAMADSDPKVSAILLSINSPGGIVAGTKELADFIARVDKPIAAYVNGLAASAAFWLASATGRIFAPATAQVGSIGVIMTLTDFSGYYRKMGVNFEHVASGRYKAAGKDSKPLSDEDREYFQKHLADLHSIFKADVAEHLQISAPESQWAEAQIMTAQSALPLGLVSQIVSDESEAVKILLEENMSEKKLTLDLLAAEAPDLLQKIRDEAVEKYKAENAGAPQEDDSLVLAAVKIVCPQLVEEIGALVRKASDMKLSAAQISGMAEFFKTNDTQTPSEAASSAMLDELQKVHAATVSAQPKKPQKSALVADAERRAAK